MRRRDVTKPRDVTTARAVWGAPLGASHAGFGLALCVRVVLGFSGAAELWDGQVATHVGPRHVRTAEGVERMRLSAGQRAVALPGNRRGWSTYGAERTQPVATGRKCVGAQTTCDAPRRSTPRRSSVPSTSVVPELARCTRSG